MNLISKLASKYAGASQLHWLHGDGFRALPTWSSAMIVRPDVQGRWEVLFVSGTGWDYHNVTTISTAANQAAAQAIAERYATDNGLAITPGAHWRDKEPTAGQMRLLGAMGVTTTGMLRGMAADQIIIGKLATLLTEQES